MGLIGFLLVVVSESEVVSESAERVSSAYDNATDVPNALAGNLQLTAD